MIRINWAPTAGFERHVGRRTTVRLWGASTPPRELRRLAAIVPPPNSDGTRRHNPLSPYGDVIQDEIILRYCGPVGWLSHCWRNISGSEHADPRLHPSLWRSASERIHPNRTRCRRLGCIPSSGAMAVLFALSRCSRVRVFGFGLNGHGGVASTQGCDADVPASWCWKSATCEKYYECYSQTLLGGPDAMPSNETEPSWDVRSLNYFAEAVRYHDIRQEWDWLARLHRRGDLVWKGAPDPRVPDVDPCYRRRSTCWLPQPRPEVTPTPRPPSGRRPQGGSSLRAFMKWKNQRPRR